MQTERHPRFFRPLLLVLTLLALQCGTTREDPTGGETHFFTCETDDDCAWLSPVHRCSAGYCGTASPTSTCSRPAVSANEVVVLGDAFFAASHRITAFLEDHARQSGALSPGERYRDLSNVTDNTLALNGRGIENQYLSASAEAPAKVVIMTGGGADILLGSCDSLTADCELLVAATTAARALWQRMAADGVQRLFYAFYPDPADAELREEVDALRPLLESACDASPLPCHWIDLRESFAGKEAAYLDVSGTSPTPEGAEAAARQIGNVMQAQCAAQTP